MRSAGSSSCCVPPRRTRRTSVSGVLRPAPSASPRRPALGRRRDSDSATDCRLLKGKNSHLLKVPQQSLDSLHIF